METSELRSELEITTNALMVGGKGLPPADENEATIATRFRSLAIEPTEENAIRTANFDHRSLARSLTTLKSH